ncbi:MAG: mechanosensitive ion channel [Chloroflexi bacterium]|nr:mechanosensitive ion channel [Chloroflexota bacterium]
MLQRVCDAVIATLDGLVLVIIAAAAIAITLSREGPQALMTPETIKLWFMEHGLLVLLIAAIAYLLYLLLKSVIPNIVESSMSARGRGKKAREDLARRVQTLSSSLTTLVGIVIGIAAVFMILTEVGVNVTPLLATAGVAGIAIGLGAQGLIKDLFAGLFILTEDQYNKGDVVKVAGIAGLVEDVTLKRTVLRDLDGIVHSIPNGEITTASNYTKQYSRLHLDVPVAYGEDLDHCIDVINRVGQEMAEDPAWAPKIRSAPRSLGVNKFGDSGIDIKVLGDTKPMKQWEVTREFRLRIKKAFDQEGIEIPWPHLKLYYGEQAPPLRVTCPSCNCRNSHESKFCSQCGTPLQKTLPPNNA